MKVLAYQCCSCGADWQKGDYSEACEECGGVALERNCLFCSGKCGQVYTKALMDTHDTGTAHWIGCCGLPAEEQAACRQEWKDKYSQEQQAYETECASGETAEKVDI